MIHKTGEHMYNRENQQVKNGTGMQDAIYFERLKRSAKQKIYAIVGFSTRRMSY
jgi:hypothetical protein